MLVDVFLTYDIYRLVYDNILHDCDNLNENLFSLLMDVGGFLLLGLAGLGYADEAYDLRRYADELLGASRFADDAVRRVDDLAASRRHGDDVAKNVDCLLNSFSADTPVMTDAGEVPISQIAVGDRRDRLLHRHRGDCPHRPQPPRTDHR